MKATTTILGMVMTLTMLSGQARAQYYDDVPLGLWVDFAVHSSTIGGVGGHGALNVRSRAWLFSFRAGFASDGQDWFFGNATNQLNEVGILVGGVHTSEFYQLSASLGAAVTWTEAKAQSSSFFSGPNEWRSSGKTVGIPLEAQARLKLPSGFSNLSLGFVVTGNINLLRPYVAAGVVFAIGAF